MKTYRDLLSGISANAGWTDFLTVKKLFSVSSSQIAAVRLSCLEGETAALDALRRYEGAEAAV